MSRFEKQFDELPEDLQRMVYSKIVFKQPKELLVEIENHYKYSEIIKLVTTKKMKPTLENMTNALVDNLSPEQLHMVMKIVNKKCNS